MERENEPHYETKNLPGDGIPPKDGGRHEEDISQQRAEGFEGGDEFGGTEEAQEPREGQVVPIEAHARREDAVGGEDEDCEDGGNCERFLQECSDFFFHRLILPFGFDRDAKGLSKPLASGFEIGDYNKGMKKFVPRTGALKLAKKVRRRLADELGHPVKVILFGSQARGDATRESDVDLLVVVPALDNAVRKKISNATWEVGFEAGKLVCAIPTTERDFEYYRILPLYQAVRKEGIAV